MSPRGQRCDCEVWAGGDGPRAEDPTSVGNRQGRKTWESLLAGEGLHKGCLGQGGRWGPRPRQRAIGRDGRVLTTRPKALSASSLRGQGGRCRGGWPPRLWGEAWGGPSSGDTLGPTNMGRNRRRGGAATDGRVGRRAPCPATSPVQTLVSPSPAKPPEERGPPAIRSVLLRVEIINIAEHFVGPKPTQSREVW